MAREPLPVGYWIQMANGGRYQIESVVGEGGYSIVYSVKEAGGTSGLTVIKEFFPFRGAHRDERLRIVPNKGCEEQFKRHEKRFYTEARQGALAQTIGFQAISFRSCGEGYALMQCMSRDMASFRTMTEGWEKTPPAGMDPVFSDLGRARYALQMIDSLLAFLAVFHREGGLHLDISPSNVFWGGQDWEGGRNCEAFLIDFGCSVHVTDAEGYFQPVAVSASDGFAAPELYKNGAVLTPATDLYAVGRLLLFLLAGRSSCAITHNVEDHIRRRCIGQMKLQPKLRNALADCLVRSCAARQEDRFQSAQEMQDALRALQSMIPRYPINRSDTRNFTLASLKAMVYGTVDTQYSWAEELCDRNGRTEVHIPEDIHQGLTTGPVESDERFLTRLLPSHVMQELMDDANHCSVYDIISGDYPDSLRSSLAHSFRGDGPQGCSVYMRELFQRCETLLEDEAQYDRAAAVLFDILGTVYKSDGWFLWQCHIRCAENDRHLGLAMLALYALLGPSCFHRNLVKNISESARYFRV